MVFTLWDCTKYKLHAPDVIAVVHDFKMMQYNAREKMHTGWLVATDPNQRPHAYSLFLQNDVTGSLILCPSSQSENHEYLTICAALNENITHLLKVCAYPTINQA